MIVWLLEFFLLINFKNIKIYHTYSYASRFAIHRFINTATKTWIILFKSLIIFWCIFMHHHKVLMHYNTKSTLYIFFFFCILFLGDFHATVVCLCVFFLWKLFIMYICILCFNIFIIKNFCCLYKFVFCIFYDVEN